ncbi:MAG: secretin N-terminal domain-containing protein [bacterium]|jgi:type II secretion system protein D|nr:secretin N-terminal domain-containing protein [bacterium]
MKFSFYTGLILLFLLLSNPLSPLDGLAQPAANAPQSATATIGEASPASNNLGSFFAQTLQEILKEGKFFYPNGTGAQAVEGKEGEQKKYKLNFNNAPIDQVLKFMTDINNKVVMRTDQVQGQFTIINPNEVTKDEAMQIIDTAFMLKGITYIETDMMILVLTVAEAKQKGVQVRVEPNKTDMPSSMQHRIFEVKYAAPSQLREALSSLMSPTANIIADDRTRTLVITDTVSNLERLEEIIHQLDKEGIMDDYAIRVFQLQYLDAREISREIGDILEGIANTHIAQSSDRRRGSNIQIEVLADRATNSLIISAPRLALEELEQFIKNLDSSASDRIKIKTFTLKNADAASVVQTLQTLSQSRRTSFYQPAIAADSRTNTLVIAAYEEDMKSIETILDILDNDKSYDKETRVYMMENADAITLKTMLESLLSDESQSNRNSWYYYSRRGTEDTKFRIIEDQRLNALIITAKPSDFPMIEELIAELDKPLPDSKEEPRVFPVKNVRASDLAMLMTQLFQEDQGNRNFFYYGMQNQQGLTGLSGKVKIIADPTTNSVIVIAGTPRAFDVVEKLLMQLDRLAPEFGTTKVFRLRNADCEYLAEQLNTLFEEDANRQNNRGFYWFMNQSSQMGDSEFSQLIGNVRIVSETRTNSLLVTTNSQYFDAVEKLINDLDKETAQVLIEILIVELIDSDDNSLGIDWANRIPITMQPSFDATMNQLNSARAAILSSANFTMVLDYLSSKSKTNVVAKPNILTRDNQSAFVEVKTEVPYVSSILLTNSGAQPQTDWRPVGLELSVTPHINDVTRVTIDVDLGNGQIVENLSLQTEGLSVPAFSTRTIQTQLSIEHEETAVLSGVIDSSLIESQKGIPGLMHIPLLGNIFKTKTKKMAKTELITFITPYILSDFKDRQVILERHQKRISSMDKLEEINGISVKSGTK